MLEKVRGQLAIAVRPKASISAKVIRADGTVEDLGVVWGGNIWNRFRNFLRRITGRYNL